MVAIFKIINALYKLFILKVSNERRNNYLRRMGVKIGNNCIIHSVSFSDGTLFR